MDAVPTTPDNQDVAVPEEAGALSDRAANRDDDATFDDVLKAVGEFGRYQKLIYFLFSLPYVVTAAQLMGWVFVGARLHHRCRQDEVIENVSMVSHGFNTSSCDYNATISGCPHGYVYDTFTIGDSVVVEWDLVCQDEGWHATIGAAQMVGYLFGGLILGSLSDKIGRKKTFILSNILLLLSGVSASAAPDYYSFTAARVGIGFSIAGIEGACFVLVMELVGPSKRTLAGIVCWFFETAGLMTALVLAYFFNDNWRLLQLLYSLPSAAFTVYYWTTPESTRWLISQGRKEEARQQISTLAKVNGVVLPSGLLHRMERTVEREIAEENAVQKTYSIIDLFRHFHMRVKSAVLTFTWIVCASLYYVLLLDQSELSANPYIGFLITTAVQIPGYFYVIATLERPALGRKRSLCGFLILSGLMLFFHPVAPSEYLAVALSIFGRFCANCSYTTLHLFSAEQFPTVVRGIGMGYSYVVSRFGTIFAPYILLLGPYSSMVFGVGAFAAGWLSLMLPETLGRRLPETLADGESYRIALPKCCKK